MDSKQRSGGVAVCPIPDDGLLLHIGVYKTGTSTLQKVLRSGAQTLRAADILYRGPHNQKPLVKISPDDPGVIEDVLAGAETAVSAHGGRVVVSSERLCMASDESARIVVERLGGDRPVHVMITIRALADLLPSSWQQMVKTLWSFTMPYEEWLQAVVSNQGLEARRFWRRNNFPELVRRWGDIVGQENVTVVVTSKQHPDRILRVTEQLLGMSGDQLELPRRSANESKSYEQAELLRQIKVRKDLLKPGQYKQVLNAVSTAAREQPTSSTPIPVPDWAATALVPIAEDYIQLLDQSPATIVGDLTAITHPAIPTSPTASPPQQAPINLAVAAVTAALAATATSDASREPGTKRRAGSASAEDQPRTWISRQRHRINDRLRR